jgi:hypothetical protein
MRGLVTTICDAHPWLPTLPTQAHQPRSEVLCVCAECFALPTRAEAANLWNNDVSLIGTALINAKRNCGRS